MRFTIILVLACIAFIGQSSYLSAQPPFGPDLGKRLPDDSVEGTIWEYKCTPKANVKEGETIPTREGKFRFEDSAILDVSPRFKLPGKDEVKGTIDSLIRGEAPEIKLPEGPQQKRLGQYRKLRGGKYRLDFDDPESLHGLMIIWKKKNTNDVWMGTYNEMEKKKIVSRWVVELRPIED
ncbi:hypothetical protein [Calycomorphotria hydatis]|uniref:Uncharacterized protein n=1 Tax=Calycomorphotria hydatis TaxID=2528027 RepID=A0A517T3R0_9PLAN|nr:hypothetical protein [Calycomorphotria hydatis]QDT62981.1 hypothetical protein V22_01790 [Calycomorphotria hydatis]